MLGYVTGPDQAEPVRSTIGGALDLAAAHDSEALALISQHQGLRWTYGRLAAESDCFARSLLALGVGPGERVAVWSPNCAEWAAAQFGTAKVGAILVAMHLACRADDLVHMLGITEASVLVVARGLAHLDYMAALRECVPELDAHDPGKLHSARLPTLRHVIILDEQGGPKAAWSWRQFLAMGSVIPAMQLALRASTFDTDDPAVIQFTSGGGKPARAVTFSHSALLTNGQTVANGIGLTSGDRVCLPIPFYHCFGSVVGSLGALCRGAAVVLPSRSFDSTAVSAAVQGERCTVLCAVPTMISAQLNEASFDGINLSSLRTVMMGGWPFDSAIIRALHDRLPLLERVVACAYGASDVSPILSLSVPGDPLDRVAAMEGTLLPYVEASVIDPLTGELNGHGGPGELCLRGSVSMSGVWEGTGVSPAAGPDGWAQTGELATVTVDGRLGVLGLRADLIMAGNGRLVVPRYVEEVVASHPSVAGVVVSGVAAGRGGEVVCAWVQRRPGSALTESELATFCRSRLPRSLQPQRWQFADAFPKTETGRPDRAALRHVGLGGLP